MLNSHENQTPASQPGISKQQIYAHADEQAKKLMQPPVKGKTQGRSMLLSQDGNTWMYQADEEPDTKMLFDEFWNEGELCILFADTNLGKSILAVQIADSISRGQSISPFKLQVEPQKVLYLDFELTKKQFQHRYKNGDEQYRWAPGFIRAEIDPDNAVPPGNYSFEEYLNRSLEKEVEENQVRVLIIDNLTYLRNETEKAKDALPLMKHLKNMKVTYNISILALAHTPKRDPSRAITRNDLQGSKMLMNFCDSAFSIGESQKDSSLRYLKQVKQRNTQEKYGGENVCLFQIIKPGTFLKFDFIDFGYERQHLREQTDQERETLRDKVLDMQKQGKSMRETAAILKISKGKVERIIKAANKFN